MQTEHIHMHRDPIGRSLTIQFLITVVDHLFKPKKIINRKAWKKRRKGKKGRSKGRSKDFHLIESS